MDNLLLKHRSCIFENKSYSIETILQWHKREKINLNPEYQRGIVWSRKKKQKFIDTILLQFPFPNVTFLQNQQNKRINFEYECVDGKQRLTSIIEFANDKFTVTIKEEALQNLAEYYYQNKTSYFDTTWMWNKFTSLLTKNEYDKLFGPEFKINSNHKYLFSQLPAKLRSEFTDYQIPCLILKGDWSPECVFDIFQRVQNGVALTTGEMINAQMHSNMINKIKSVQNQFMPLIEKITTNSTKNYNWLILILGCISIHITKDLKYLHASRMITFPKDFDKEGQSININVIIDFLKAINEKINHKIDKWDLFLLFYVYDVRSLQFYDFLKFFIQVDKPPAWDFEKESYKTITKKYLIYLNQRNYQNMH